VIARILDSRGWRLRTEDPEDGVTDTSQGPSSVAAVQGTISFFRRVESLWHWHHFSLSYYLVLFRSILNV
jgi:hypothetical protein